MKGTPTERKDKMQETTQLPPDSGQIIRRFDQSIRDANQMQSTGFSVVDIVHAHWAELRHGRVAPARSELDPRNIASALEYVFVAELIAPGVARIRIAGAHFSDLMGMDVRGMPLSALFVGPARDEVIAAVACVATGARANIPLCAEKGLGRPALDGLLSMMPLTDHTGKICRILGVLGTMGQIGRAPRRFELAPRPKGRDTLRDLVCNIPALVKNSAMPLPNDGAPRPLVVQPPNLVVISGGRQD
jgi:hypothetical protein